jgi:hypothetical protein
VARGTLRVAHGIEIIVIDLQSILEVLVPFRQCLGPVRDFTALDDALPRGLCAPDADESRKRAGIGRVILDIPVGRDEGLPDPGQVGIVRALQPWGTVCLGLTNGRRTRQPDHGSHGGHGHRERTDPPLEPDPLAHVDTTSLQSHEIASYSQPAIPGSLSASVPPGHDRGTRV